MTDEYLSSHPHTRLRRVQRWLVKQKRPDGSTGRWNPDDRSRVVAYLRWRDDRKCGLCALAIKQPDAQIEHVVPKKFGWFDIKGNKQGRRAIAGREWRSRLHHPDNLQVAHQYCNRAKGNTPDPLNWRHPDLRPLPVAERRTEPTLLWIPSGFEASPTTGDLPIRIENVPASSRRIQEQATSPSSNPPLSGHSDDELLHLLKEWRKSKARDQNKPAFTILTDRTLHELVSTRPRRLREINKVYGIGPAKLDRYGQEILDLIRGSR